mmetsp:Transcript_19386/g.29523  ORF Transcript_19386/g.29523 Transcript_19386/m.29523 type:complete len:687 (-) Transcript_19386:105-2165(-)|eukprot:CAMPEP_0194203944 /NCGR_PEP_ID=MMETSP0156-20130528/3584_1 /TAXON_ID=33649 /ORGANISM="Thalassionema nitzschioides, Strain L26-B" /LENGTH=686 /DNA_ID=CAMNT_0038929807 /DNA_START=79 /DNA_END=2139 /DNA_ORIENTATION=+
MTIDTTHTSFSNLASVPLMNVSSEEGKKHYDVLRASLKGADDKLNPFPFDLSSYQKIAIDPFTTDVLTPEQVDAIEKNISLCRDVMVFFTSCGNKSGYGGHTGGAFDTVPEVVLFDAFFRACPDQFLPVFYDEAGHRVATQYLMAALDGYISPEFLRFYRKGHAKLPGHPELGLTPGIQFSSGRLGHMWATVNGIAMANPGKRILLLGSDGSQMEGNNAEAARLAVAQKLNVKLVIDDNDITITGHPTQYLPGFDLEQTLQGHGLAVTAVQGEDLVGLYAAVRAAVTTDGPYAVIAKRSMAPGIHGVEGTSHGHDAVAAQYAIPYLQKRGHKEAAEYLELATATKDPHPYQSCGTMNAMRKVVGQTVTDVISGMSTEEKTNVMVIDSDLGGSTNFNLIQKSHPEIYVQSGVMERGNFAAAAGFGMHPQKQGVFSTFAAFLEMLCSEITMARLNRSNIFSHFSHSGVDDMSDNTCHFGLNLFFADNGLNDGYDTKLYFPADCNQAKKLVEATFPLSETNKGLRFVFTTRSKTPMVLKEDGETPFYDDSYTFVPGKDEIIREGSAGYIVSFGDALYRSLDAVVSLKAEGIDVGLINKPTLNVVDEEIMEKLASAPLCLVVEPLGCKTGLGSKFGSWLLMTKYAQSGGKSLCKFGSIATHHEGCGGLWEQAYHQGFDSKSVQEKVKSMI